MHPAIEWKNYWAKTLAFDALIGNTDRHQDNWGIIETPIRHGAPKMRISPVFDNGTSMGHEIFPHRFEYYSHNENIKKYVLKGQHHMKWTRDDISGTGHLEMLKKIIEVYPETHQSILECLKKVGYVKNLKISLDCLLVLMFRFN